MSSNMKILHCTEFDYPDSCGVNNVVRGYAEYIAKKGDDSWVVTGGTKKENVKKNNYVKIKYIPIRGNIVKGIKGDINIFISFLKEENFDIIICYAAQTWHFDILMRVDRKLIPHSKLIVFPCGFSGLLSWRRLLYKRYFKKLPLFLSNFDACILHSKNYIDHEYISSHFRKIIKILPNGIRLNEFNIERDTGRVIFSKYGIDDSKKVVINISNHFFDKNHKDLIKLARKNPEIEFVQIGNPHYGLLNCTIKCCNASSKINNYHSLQVSREEVIRLLINSDMFILTSRTEMFPLVILEAMAAKTPFISYNVGCVKQLKGGIIVENFKELNREMNRIIYDDYKLKELGEEGSRDVTENYNIETVLKNYRIILESIYENC